MNNDLDQFSEERLKQLASGKYAGTGLGIQNREVAPLARIALSVKQAKPVVDIEPLATAIMKTIDAETDKFHSAYTLSELRIAIVKTLSALTTPQPAHTEQAISDGWKLVPIEPTEDMVINGFESKPDKSFTPDIDWEAYDAMSGCEQAAHRAKLCWQAMLRAAPKPESE